MSNYTAREQQGKLTLFLLPKGKHINLPLPFFIQKHRLTVFFKGALRSCPTEIIKKM